MTIYQMKVSDPQAGVMVSYHPTKDEALKAFSLAESDNAKLNLYGIYKHKISPTKKGVLNFLNCHTPDKDNG